MVGRVAWALAGLFLSLTGAGSWAQRPPAAAPKIFAGRVLEIHVPEKWFVMEGGASRLHPRVKVIYDGKTHWSGPAARLKNLRVGDAVSIDATPATGGAFKAVTIRVQDPNAKPRPAGASPGG